MGAAGTPAGKAAPPPRPGVTRVGPPAGGPTGAAGAGAPGKPRRRTGMIVAVVAVAVLLVAGAGVGAYYVFGQGSGGGAVTYPESYVITDPPAGMHLLDLKGDKCEKVGFVPLDDFADSMGLTSNPGYMDDSELTSDSGGPVPKRAYVAVMVSDDCSALAMSMAAEMKSVAELDTMLKQEDNPCEGPSELTALRKDNILVVAGLVFGENDQAKAALEKEIDAIASRTGATDVC